MAVSWPRTQTIARTEIRRRWRTTRDNPSQLIGFALMALFLLPAVAAAIGGAFVAGQFLRSGDATAPIEAARTGAVGIWIATAIFGGIRGYTSLLDPDNRDGLLATISHRQLLAGILLAEGTVIGLPTVVVVALASVTFGIGAGSVIAPLMLFIAVSLLAALGFATGIGIALLIKNGGVRSRLLYRLRTVAFVIGFAAYFWVIFSSAAADIFEPLLGVLTPTPIGWAGESVVLAAGLDASIPRAAAGVLLTAGGLLVAVPALTRLSGWLWYADGLETTHTVSESTPSTGGLLSGLLPQPIRAVVAVDWARARRAPISLSYAIYPLFILVMPVIETFETGTVGGLFPILIAFAGAWITGALFTLNVLGNEGAVLPATVLTASPERALVGGHVAAGVLLGLPVTILLIVVLGVLSPTPPVLIATLSAGAAILTVSAPLIATGIGAALPRHEAVSVSRSTEAIVPSTFGFLLYSAVISIVALPVLLAHIAPVGQFVGDALGLSVVSIALVGIALTTVVAVAFGLFSTLFAVRTVRKYRLE
ncbi:MAG: hypothetical protein J07HN6_00079 [Halonotius sp. J07HN6]|nr:MAG: hypothetical protein J07HN6_00079 [Halonotius sp. J07HN6]